MRQFAEFGKLLNESATGGGRIVVVVEDACRLGPELVAELESLTAADSGESPGANLVLLGPPQLEELLGDPQLARLQQRIVANQKKHVREPGRPWEMGGVIYSGSADKAARFILDCNQNRIPLVFLHDVNGFMVGPESEKAGIIRAGAKMVNAVSNSVVPKLTVILGGSFGAGHYAMCGKAYDPNFIVAWPQARYCVMGADQAAGTITDVRAAAMKRKGQSVDEEELKAFYKEVAEKYERETDPLYAAARLWVDAVIDPRETRTFLRLALEAAAPNPDVEPLRTGVFQT